MSERMGYDLHARSALAIEPVGSPLMSRLIEPSRDLPTPFLLVDLERVRENYRRLVSAFDNARVYYAVKANPHPTVLRALAEEGCGFEISSDGELDLIEALARLPSIVSSNPIKTERFIVRAARSIEGFAIDSVEELEKVARVAPGASVYVRLLVDNSGSEWPLARKYGIGPSEATDLLVRASALGLRPRGTTFHVGSQCRVSASWDDALAVTAEVWNGVGRQGIELDLLGIGGGFPVHHTRPIPGLNEIADVVRHGVAERFPPGVQLTLEPGRMIVGDAALLGASVIGKARRGAEEWVYLDVGVFNGLMEAIEGFSYEVLASTDGPRHSVVLAGPSCDSVDVISDSIALAPVDVGDRVYILSAGAYTLSYASNFNGWPPPTVHFASLL
jgi:ornithine decarboxylase